MYIDLIPDEESRYDYSYLTTILLMYINLWTHGPTIFYEPYIYLQVLVQQVMLCVTPEGPEIVLTPRRWILETELVINLFSGINTNSLFINH